MNDKPDDPSRKRTKLSLSRKERKKVRKQRIAAFTTKKAQTGDGMMDVDMEDVKVKLARPKSRRNSGGDTVVEKSTLTQSEGANGKAKEKKSKAPKSLPSKPPKKKRRMTT